MYALFVFFLLMMSASYNFGGEINDTHGLNAGNSPRSDFSFHAMFERKWLFKLRI